MSPTRSSKTRKTPAGEETAVGEILGYLNFSGGTSDPAFQRNFNQWFASLPAGSSAAQIRRTLLESLSRLGESTPALSDAHQAESVIRLLFDECLPAYRKHHCDLLFHLSDEDFLQPFFLVRYWEAILSSGAPWDETERIVGGSLEKMNDFLGHRPLAVLENDRQMEPYAHERFSPVPLYLKDAGSACGKYHDLIERTIRFFRETPQEILEESWFDLSLMEELSLDVRAHDHTHPMNKRTNYMFGEWDPHKIDNKGNYRRFVVRKIILDFLLEWMADSGLSREEALYDASAVLCGTMLMASAISGSGPNTHDSAVTLTSLLPRVARQRDEFYSRLLKKAGGTRAKRLLKQAELTQQPFGHVRKDLNIRLTGYGARQIQCRRIAYLFSRMGYSVEAQQKAAEIPSVSSRIESEIQWRMTAAQRELENAQLSAAVRLIGEIEDYLHRGIECGAVCDPWNILGFQGQYPLFSSREDSVPDQRIETLLEIMQGIFDLYTRALGESAVQGDEKFSAEISDRHRKLADFWDQFATTVVSDLPEVSGRESWESATGVARALQEWRGAGEAAGDISFWRNHVDRFESAGAYAQVVEALLHKKDHVAAMGLMMQWLSQAAEVGLESGGFSLNEVLLRWMGLAIENCRSNAGGYGSDFWPTVRRLFDYLEANAGEFWNVPSLDAVLDLSSSASSLGDELTDAWGDDAQENPFEDSDENLFEAAYEGVVYRDSADDGHFGETLDDGYSPLNTEFELIYRELEPRLKFLETMAELWRLAATALDSFPPSGDDTEQTEILLDWHNRVSKLQNDLILLMTMVYQYEIGTLPGDVDSNMEYDVQLQTKFYLLHALMSLCLRYRMTGWHLLARLPRHWTKENHPEDTQLIAGLIGSVIRGDVVSVREALPAYLKRVSKKPMLYVSLENGGKPQQVFAVRTLQTIFRFLLEHLPRLGLLNETWQVLNAAMKMERTSRPVGAAVTEFDRLFNTALDNTLRCVVRSAKSWNTAPHRNGRSRNGELEKKRICLPDRPLPQEVVIRKAFPLVSLPFHKDEELVELVQRIVESYHRLWVKYSRGIRLSRVEELNQKEDWEDVVEFIDQYGAELFHAGMLTLGNVRSILHNGIDSFLDYLQEYRDPLQPMRLLDDLDEGRIALSDAVDILEVIYEAFLDKLECFLEYNTTTTQSDYGEKFYCLLDFLRVECGYERDAWNFRPFTLAHETLAESGRDAAVSAWEEIFSEKVGRLGDKHLRKLRKVEKAYGMQLPSVSDLLNEQFVKGLAVNRMQALIPKAIQEKHIGRQPSKSFPVLQNEIDDYLQSTTGSAFDIPVWLQSLEQVVNGGDGRPKTSAGEVANLLQPVRLRKRQLLNQLARWERFSSGK